MRVTIFKIIVTAMIFLPMIDSKVAIKLCSKCIGAKVCKACKNCKYCKHCSKEKKGTCGACIK
jgi:hypothetical protein